MKKRRISTYILEWIRMSSVLLLLPLCANAQTETINVPLTDEEWKEALNLRTYHINSEFGRLKEGEE